MKRSKHSLSHYVLSTFDMGELIPVGHFEVLPGDSIRMSTSALLRVSPLMAPVMHPVSVRLHHWYVPYRILWDGWEDFITGGPLGTTVGPPPQGDPAGAVAGSLGDYLGIPPATTAGVTVNTFPLSAYNAIWNENYRDQDLQAESAVGWNVKKVSWEKDYFTAARPWTQKGPAVTLPLGVSAPVIPTGDGIPSFAGGGTPKNLQFNNTSNAPVWNAAATATGAASWSNTKLVADLAAASSIEVNDVRLAFALQRYQEARAQYGSRYTEYLRYLGVRSSDARLQRPEYLGGGRATISFSEVLKTGEGDTPSDETPVGEMRGHGISAMRSRRWIRFFEEHGVVMTLCSIRPRSIYANGLHRSWSRLTKEDFWQKELEQIGQQEVYNKEVYNQHATPNGVFGFQDRYSDYRHLPSYVCGDFRSTLNDWHLARIFAAPPALNASFIECVPSKRIHAEQTQDVIWGMFSHSIQARRMVGHKTIGRIF